jgi:hypothetical protein
MYPLLALAVLGVVFLGTVLWNGSTTEYMVDRVVEEKVVEVLPEWASNEQAVKAAQDVIRKQELEAELATLNEEVATREARIEEIEKELGTF